MAGNVKARRGHSKEKRSDCPLVTLALMLDGSGFLRRSRIFVVSRERTRQFTAEQAVEISIASRQTIQVQRVVSEDGSEVRLYCHSEQRQEKEAAMNARFIKRFEDGLLKIAEGLAKPGGTKKRDKVLNQIGRLQEKSCGIGQHYRIDVVQYKLP
jgi:hypothetical protein